MDFYMQCKKYLLPSNYVELNLSLSGQQTAAWRSKLLKNYYLHVITSN